MSTASAALNEALAVARRIVSDELPPDHGAARIWRLAAEADYHELEELRIFAGLASEWSEHPNHRDGLNADIREQAWLLLQRHEADE